MGKPPRYQSGKKIGRLDQRKSFPVVPIHQGAKHTLYSFSEKASELWKYVSINRREENKDDGYQRVLSNSRVRAVADYIKDGNFIPGSIIISVDKGTGDPKSFFADQRDANFAFSSTLIRLLLALTSDVQAQSGVEILQTSYAPCLTKFDGFSHAKIEGLYSELYRKEGYGVDI